MIKSYLSDIVKYNLWANKRLGKLILEIDENLIAKEVPGSFNTLQEMILHMWGAETAWLKRLKGESLEEWPGKYFEGSREDLVMQWLHRSNELAEFVTNMGDGYFERDCKYKNLKGDDFSTPVPDVIIHLVNHSTYHRGELVTMMHFLGIEKMVSTDYINFTREEGLVM